MDTKVLDIDSLPRLAIDTQGGSLSRKSFAGASDQTPLPRLADQTNAQMQRMLAADYITWLACCTEHKSHGTEVYLQRFPRSVGATFVKKSRDRWQTKAAVAPGTSTDATWASPLVGPKELADAFIAIARSASLIGRIPGLRKVPFATKIPIEDVGANFYWVAENEYKPVSRLSFSNTLELPPLKGQGILVLSAELVKLAADGLPGAMLDTLVSGLTSFVDRSFLDPLSTAIAGKRPASVTSTTTAIPSTGDYAADVQTLLTAFFAARPNAQQPMLVTSAGHAAQIFSMNGGGGVGVPVIISGDAGANTIALDGPGIFLADEGAEIDQSEHATLQMNDTPDNPGTAASVLVSLWQMNLRGLKVERFVNWSATAGSVKYLAP